MLELVPESGLEDVDRELAVVITRRYGIGRCDDRGGGRLVEDAELGIRTSRGLLDSRESLDVACASG